MLRYKIFRHFLVKYKKRNLLLKRRTKRLKVKTKLFRHFLVRYKERDIFQRRYAQYVWYVKMHNIRMLSFNKKRNDRPTRICLKGISSRNKWWSRYRQPFYDKKKNFELKPLLHCVYLLQGPEGGQEAYYVTFSRLLQQQRYKTFGLYRQKTKAGESWHVDRPGSSS